jgi:hypothetical protein
VREKEVRMPTRLVSLPLLLLLCLPLFSQRTGMSNRVDQWIWSRGKMMGAGSPAGIDPGAVRLKAIHDDAQELSSLSSSMQADLQQLQNGLLAKDLVKKLRKIEKLSKRLRQEVGQ